MKLSDLRLNNIRTTFTVDIGCKSEEVTIFNVVGEKRSEVLDMMVDKQNQGLSEKELIEEIYTDIFFECTDLEMDDSIIDIINSPSLDMINILSEINEIIHELQCELMLKKIAEVNQMEQLAYTQLMLAKTENTTRTLNKIEKLKIGDEDGIQ